MSYVITGANRGIGLEFVRQISADTQNQVFAVIRNKANAANVTALGRKNVHIVEADIVDHEALKAAAAAVAKLTGGSLDYLINNAAFYEPTRNHTLDGYPEEQLLEKDLWDSFNVNVIGVIHTINAFLPLLKKGTVKKVISLSSGVGDLDFILGSMMSIKAPYAISKAALNMVVAKYAAQYKSEDFVFLAISPGFVNTSTKEPTPEDVKNYLAMVDVIKRVKPDFQGAITPEESVKDQLEVIYRWSVKDTGAFVSHHGNKDWL